MTAQVEDILAIVIMDTMAHSATLVKINSTNIIIITNISVTDNCVAINCNLGTCKLDASGEAQCICPQNWTGEFCATDVNECLDNPCAPGAGCDNIDGGYECSCPIGYEGDGTKEGTGCSGKIKQFFF